MKFLVFFLILFLNFPLSTYANFYLEDREIPQGETLEIRFLKDTISEIDASVNGDDLEFYSINVEPLPHYSISRAEFLKLLFDNLGYDLSGYDDLTDFSLVFDDVTKQSLYFSYIVEAYNLGIIDGYEDGLFHPRDTITRGQAAKIILNTIDALGEKYIEVNEEDLLVTTISKLNYSDLSSDNVFYPFIEEATRRKIFNGYPDGTFRESREMNYYEADLILERAFGQEFELVGEVEYLRAFVAFHRIKDEGIQDLDFDISYLGGGQKHVDMIVDVKKQDYRTESFYLPESKTELLGSTYQDNTWDLINQAKANPQEDQLYEGAFIVPTEGEITLGFGDILYINGAYSGSHFGIDYANIEGTEILASNSGVVTLAQETMSYGNTIVIDHGQNVFTMYLHLSALDVDEGEQVEKGQKIGEMGDTGVATGSHLHFTHFIGDIIVDSQRWFNGEF